MPALKKLMFCVRPGVFDTFTRRLRLKILFMIVDLPTFERPTNDTSGSVEAGTWSGRPYEAVKATFW